MDWLYVDVERTQLKTWVKIIGGGIALMIVLGGCLIATVGTASTVLWFTRNDTAAAAPTAAPAPTQAPTAPPSVATATSEPAEIEEVPEHGDEKPQPQIRHPSPSMYVKTGKGITKTWDLSASADEVIIVGGWSVDGKERGVYRAIAGPTTFSVTVTDGFVEVIEAEWAQAEFCFRLSQAEEFGWGHATEEPLASWEACK